MRPFRWHFLQFFFGFISLLPILALFAFIVPPSSFVFFQWLGLIIFFLSIANAFVLVISISLTRLNYVLPLVSLCVSFYFFTFMFQWNRLSPPVEQIDLKTATYNVRDMRYDYGLSTLDQLVEFSEHHNLDLLFMQEVPAEYNEKFLLEHFKDMKYATVTYDTLRWGQRLAILSKYPITNRVILSSDERSQFALQADLKVGEQKLRLINCHLQTTSWNQVKHSENYFLEESVLIISDNFQKRERQTKKICELMDSSSLPLIVAGDFNETPVSYSYHKIGSGLTDSFRSAGNGYSYTYKNLKKLFRIDYIFYDKKAMSAYNYRTENLVYSDHLPVLVDFVLKK